MQSHLAEYLGRLHPLFVHFPIAFLLGAGLVEIIALLRRKALGGPAASAMLICALVGSLVAVPLGWLNASTSNHPGAEKLVEYHRWAGVATLAITVVALGLMIWLKNSRTRVLATIYLVVLLLAVGAAIITAHWGGEIIYGEGYFSYAGASEEIE
jgi:uncharacterized membrane protein